MSPFHGSHRRLRSGVTTWLVFAQLFICSLTILWGSGSATSLIWLLIPLTFGPRAAGAVAWGKAAEAHGRDKSLSACASVAAVGSAVGCALELSPFAGHVAEGLRFALTALFGFAAGGAWPITAVDCFEGTVAGRRGRAGLVPQAAVAGAVITTVAVFVIPAIYFSSTTSTAVVCSWHLAAAGGLATVSLARVRRVQPSNVAHGVTGAAARVAGVRASISRQSWRRIVLASSALTTTFMVFGLSTRALLTQPQEHFGTVGNVVASIEAFAPLGVMAVIGGIAAAISDRCSRKMIVLLGTATVVVASPLIAVTEGRSWLESCASLSVLAIPAALPFGCGPALLPALFPSRHRSTCVGLAYAGGAMVGSIVATVVGTVASSAGPSCSAAVISLVAVLSTACVVAVIHETAASSEV